MSTTVAERVVAAARTALSTAPAAVAREVLTADLALLDDLDRQVAAADAQLARLLPATCYAVLTSTPGWGSIRAAGYAAALGPPDRWPSHRQVYRAAGLTPNHHESAGHRRDDGINREGSVELRRTLIDLGVGLWHSDPAARRYGLTPRERGIAWRGHRLRARPLRQQDCIHDDASPDPLRPEPLELIAAFSFTTATHSQVSRQAVR